MQIRSLQDSRVGNRGKHVSGPVWSWILVLFLSCPGLAQEEITTRVALVIGVQNYTSITPLRHSLNDAHDMAIALKSHGFSVIESYEPKSKKEMQDVIRKYYDQIKMRPGAAGLIYYSGHGMQVDGFNYLIPLDANPQIKADLDDQCLKMEFIMQALEQAGNSLNILILDACRNNPFRGFTRSTEKGLNMVDAPKGSYVVYATKPGSVASDGTGRNGLFTSKLLQYMGEQDLNIEQVFKKVARDVSDESGEAQRPWITSDYTGDFYFTKGQSSAGPQGASKVNQSRVEGAQPLSKNAAPVNALSADKLFKEAKSLEGASKFPEAISYYEQAAELGHAQSQNNLGDIYSLGKGAQPNFGLAAKWYRMAARQNMANAQLNLGTLYEQGDGVEKNFDSAKYWYYAAATNNSVLAQYNLGMLHLKGRGGFKDEQEALKWLVKAGDQQYIPAQNALGEFYLLGGDTVKKNRSEAIKWFRKAAEQGDNWAKGTLSSLGVK